LRAIKKAFQKSLKDGAFLELKDQPWWALLSLGFDSNNEFGLLP
jgi:hypothetical protein